MLSAQCLGKNARVHCGHWPVGFQGLLSFFRSTGRHECSSSSGELYRRAAQLAVAEPELAQSSRMCAAAIAAAMGGAAQRALVVRCVDGGDRVVAGTSSELGGRSLLDRAPAAGAARGCDRSVLAAHGSGVRRRWRDRRCAISARRASRRRGVRSGVAAAHSIECARRVTGDRAREPAARRGVAAARAAHAHSRWGAGPQQSTTAGVPSGSPRTQVGAATGLSSSRFPHSSVDFLVAPGTQQSPHAAVVARV